jgi:hypothetical protein
MARLTILDGLRGYFLVLMFLNHLTFAGTLPVKTAGRHRVAPKHSSRHGR